MIDAYPNPRRGTLYPVIAALMATAVVRDSCLLLMPCMGPGRQMLLPPGDQMAPGRLLVVGDATLHVAARGQAGAGLTLAGLRLPLGRRRPVLVLTDAQGGLWLLFPQGVPALRRLALILSLPVAHRDVLSALRPRFVGAPAKISPSG
ncbi:MAG: hypothetical protein ACK4IA_05495 [Paracoccus hibiscisoli]|uniref:hypothetical protein n=1 Tax=Paracoccus hibiscisoli TaxID=2023261 RepID=UPI00391B9CC1